MASWVGRIWTTWVYQLLGAALLTPAVAVLAVWLLAERSLGRLVVLAAVCLPAAAVVAALPIVRQIEATALAGLLGIDVPSRPNRLYLWLLTTSHLFAGAVPGGAVLAVLPAFLHIGQSWGEPSALVFPGVVVVAAGLVTTAAGSAQRWLAERLLRADPSRLIEELGHRQALALELHDSVGHALSVVLVQAMAARSALRGDPGAAERSLAQLITTAHDTQEELDVLLGVLDSGDDAHTPTLAALESLVSGMDVTWHCDPVDAVPARISRVGYAIAREALTNALRHGAGRPGLRVEVGDDLVITVCNAVAGDPVGESRRTGRGLTGMRLRAKLVGGACEIEKGGRQWRIRARLPLARTRSGWCWPMTRS
ncbi:sensor histidine kinase [Goodfellowiella coeruleoviolacea]|uniref:histidine kinase n=1 Tax=Goodfellowiella coeruleoviolacea TaxID=334858 RepID=A0AAE3KK61_9PSEU|nr:histidine kinase [Goodfellowiella coeruleoviolacea]MCP2170360.1 Signal transduction histidine kinase [Goodfellowiella coeruleoviolacea]